MKRRYKKIDHPKYKYELTRKVRCATNIRGRNLLTDYIWLLDNGALMLFKGYAWDGCSGPTIDDDTNMKAGLVHDALYQLIRLGELPQSERKKVDELFYRILRENGMSWLRAKLYYRAVRMFGGRFCRPKE